MLKSSSSRRRRTLLCSLAAALGLLVYLNVLENPFVYDDYRTIVDNGSIRTLLDPRAIVLHEVTRPIVNLSYAVDRALWRGRPVGFHVTSVLLQLLNIVLLFHIARRLADDRQSRGPQPGSSRGSPDVVAFAAAALFAVHPMMSEAVGYVSARPDVLGGTLFLLAFVFGRRWILGHGRGQWWLTVGLWLAALLAKETAIMLPAVLFCYDRLIYRGDAAERRRSLLTLHAPLAGMALLAGAARVAVFAMVERSGSVAIEWRAILDQCVVIGRYALLFLEPGRQAIVHDVPPMQGAFEPLALFAAMALAAIVAAAWRRRRFDPLARFGLLWFVLLLLPSAGLVVIDRVEPLVEHRAYLASIGLFLIAGSAVGWIGARLSQVSTRLWVVGIAAFGVVLLSLGARTVLRNALWGDPVALWRDAVEKSPDSWVARTALGEALHEAGRHDEAILVHQTALALNPQDAVEYMNVAICQAEMGRVDEAIGTIEALRRIQPASPIVPTGLAAIALLSGDPGRARGYLLETVARNPRNVMALQMLAMVEEKTANPAEALRRCEEVQRLAPGSLSTEECVQRNRLRLAGAPAER